MKSRLFFKICLLFFFFLLSGQNLSAETEKTKVRAPLKKTTTATPSPSPLSTKEQAEDLERAPLEELLPLFDVNIFLSIPKANIIFPVVFGPYPKTTYGPYEVSSDLYQAPWPKLSDVKKRLEVLAELKKKEDLSELLKIHEADLKSIQAHITAKPEDIQVAIEAYAVLYDKVRQDFFPPIAMNLVDALLLKNDTTSALPIFKKINKELLATKTYIQSFNALQVELYFQSERYDKVWHEFEDKIQRKTVGKESFSYQLRVGDILFLLKRYSEASQWYQTILKPENTNTFSENLSWLYLAESVWNSGEKEVSQKIYATMRPYFDKTIYADIIDYRMNPSEEMAKAISERTTNSTIKNWLKVENIRNQFLKNPDLFTAENLSDFLIDHELPKDMEKQVLILLARAYENENEFYKAIDIYQKISLGELDPVISKTLQDTIITNLIHKGRKSSTEAEAYQFIQFLRKFQFQIRSLSPDDLYKLLMQNLDLIGMKDLAAEMTMHIIDKSVHSNQNKSKIFVKMAHVLYKNHAYQSCLKTIDMIDLPLIDPVEKQGIQKLKIEVLLKQKFFKEALTKMKTFEAEGISAEIAYWFAVKKIEIHQELKQPLMAKQILEDMVGSHSTSDKVPPNLVSLHNLLLAHQVTLYNQLGKNLETLSHFYANQDQILSTTESESVILAALSSALALNKKSDVEKIMLIAKQKMSKETYKDLEEWTKGELWINQISDYLDNRIQSLPATQ